MQQILRTAGATAAALAVFAGCSSSGGSSAGTGGSGSGSGSSSAGSSTPTTIDAATKAGIEKAYETFFSNTSTLAQSVAALQHGETFRQIVDAEGNTSYATQSSASVSSVQLVSPDVANVKFSITSNGKVMLPSVDGKAVRENGTWKVAAVTFCGLLKLEGKMPAPCKDPAVVGLPS